MTPKVRVTAILIEDGYILLVEQDVGASRRWSLPGGTLEWEETLEKAILREMREETGLDVAVKELLYVCDRIQDGKHVVHLTFRVVRTGGESQLGSEPEADANPIKSVKMVPVSALQQYGFGMAFQKLALKNFPESGTYQGSVTNIGL